MILNGKTAVVTGAGSGIGRAVALALARGGASVVAADVKEAWCEETARLLRASGGQAIAVRVDVTNEEDVKAMFEAAERAFGGMHILVNNAGVLGGPRFPDASPRYWQRAFDVNVLGVLYGIHHGVPLMRKSGGGVIVNTASTAGLTPHLVDPVYAATKAAVVNLTRSLTFLKAEQGIRVNCVCPALVHTELEENTSADFSDAVRAEFKQRRSARRGSPRLTPDDVARAVLELVEDERLNGISYKVVLGQAWEKLPSPSPQPVSVTS